MKKVLLICFDFPPRRTSGVYRVTGLTKYLPSLGWKPTLLTVQNRSQDLEDPTLLERIPPEVRVVRTRYLNLSGWEQSVHAAARSAGALRSRLTDPQGRNVDSWLRQWARVIRAFAYFPDERVGWIPFALAQAIDLVMSERFDAVYTTSPPRSTQVIGLLLKILFDIPWVAEFRDPWLLPREVLESMGLDSYILREEIESYLNAFLVHRADSIVTVTRGYAQEIRRLFAVPGDKISVISNGFDEDDFKSNSVGEDHHLEPGLIHMSHFGTIYPGSSGKFFPALEGVLHEDPELKERLRVNIIGYPDQEVSGYSNQSSLRGIVRIRPFMNHVDALWRMRQSDCLLSFYAHRYFSRLCIPGKIYEYLRVGRPILATTFEGGLRDLVEQAGAGWTVHPDDVHGIQRALKSLIRVAAGECGAQTATAEFVAQFQYDRLAASISAVLERVATNAH